MSDSNSSPTRKMPKRQNPRSKSSAPSSSNNGARSERSKQEKERSKSSTSRNSKQQTNKISNDNTKRDPLPQVSQKAESVNSPSQQPNTTHIVNTNENNIAANNNKRGRFHLLKVHEKQLASEDHLSRKHKDEHEIQAQKETDNQLIDGNNIAQSSLEKNNATSYGNVTGIPAMNFRGVQKKQPPNCDPTIKANNNQIDSSKRQCGITKKSGGPLSNIQEITKISGNCTATEDEKVKLSHFTLIRLLGEGAYGSVFLVRKRQGDDNGTLYAMKVIKKDQVIQKSSIAEHTKSEREVLEAIQNSPFLVKMHYAFQSTSKLYLILDYVCGGDIFTHILKAKLFPEPAVCFYVAEVVLALERLHGLGIIYRDVKLENLLLDRDGHIVLTDFGLSKIFEANSDNRAYSYCGTPRYMAPEVLRHNAEGYDIAADWWSVGVLTYELLTGTSPFVTEGTSKVDKTRIHKADPEMPKIISEVAKDFILKMLQKDAKKRLGGNSKNAVEIKSHTFFNGIDWNELSRKRVNPPFKPTLVSEEDTQNFSEEFTSQPATDKPALAPSYEYTHELFRGYSYVAPDHMKARRQAKNNRNVQYCNEPVENPPLCPNTLKLDKLVKSGSFGTCYRITEKGEKTNHVAKVIPDVLYRAAEVDALISCGINGHKNICQYIDTFRKGSNIWIIMEYIEGGELQEYVNWSGGLPETMCRDIFVQLCDAVQYMHSRNFIHGDLKPENILFTDAQKKHVKIVDFGAACYNSNSTTWKCVPRYTLDYAPPEALEDDKLATYSKAFDMWCLGATLFAMYAGHPPFRSTKNEQISKAALIKRIVNVNVQNISSRWTNASSFIKHIVLKKCMVKKLEQRVTIEELRGSYLLYKSVF